jgi:hypothetical protein
MMRENRAQSNVCFPDRPISAGPCGEIARGKIRPWLFTSGRLENTSPAPETRHPQQAHEKAQAAGNVGTVAAENAALNKEANDTARTDQIDQAELERQQREAELYTRLGHVLNRPAQPREIRPDLDRGPLAVSW